MYSVSFTKTPSDEFISIAEVSETWQTIPIIRIETQRFKNLKLLISGYVKATDENPYFSDLCHYDNVEDSFVFTRDSLAGHSRDLIILCSEFRIVTI